MQNFQKRRQSRNQNFKTLLNYVLIEFTTNTIKVTIITL